MMNTRNWLNLLALSLCLVLAAGCTKASKIQRALKAADNDFQAQRFEKAEAEYQSVFRVSPNNPTAIRQLGLIYFEEGRPRALVYLKKANDLDTENHEVQLKLAELYAVNGMPTNAVPLLVSVLKSDPGNEHALLLRAQYTAITNLPELRQQLETQIREGGAGLAACHVALGWIDLRMVKTSDAAAEFHKAIELNPKSPSPYLGLGTMLSTTEARQALKTAAELSPVRSEAWLRYAQFAIDSGDEDQAKQILISVTKQASNYVPAWRMLMKMYFEEHKYEDCKAAIDKILAVDGSPPNFEALLELGEIALAQSDAPKALSAFQHLEEAYPGRTPPLVKYDMALAYFMNHEKQKGLGKIDEALHLDRDYSPAVLMLADAYVRDKKYTDAITLLKNLTHDHPENTRAMYALAEIYWKQQRVPAVLDVYRHIQFSPLDAETPRRVGVVYMQTHDFDKAREEFEKSLKASPDYFKTLQDLTELDVSQKKFEDAHSRLDKLIKDYPKAAEFQQLQGKVYYVEGKTNEAETAYSKAIELNPELAESYLALAGLYQNSHQEKEALERLAPLVAKTNLAAMQQVAEIEQTSGKYEQARDTYEKLLTFYPTFVRALNNLAYIYAEYLGNLDKGLQLAEKAREIRPTDPDTADTLGWICFKKHQYSRALTLIKESAEKNPNDPEIQMHLGMAYYMNEDEGAALASLQRAAESKVDFPDKDLAARHLEVLKIDPSKAGPDAMQKLQDMMQRDPEDPILLIRLAYLQEQLGEIPKAVESLKKLLSLNPENWPAMMRLARIYADHLNDLREGLDWAKSAHSLAPHDGGAAALLGELVFRTGDFPWSLSLLDDAAGQSPDDASISYHLALADYAVGRATAADAAMEKAVKAGDALPEIVQARQFLTLRAAAKDLSKAEGASALVKQILAKDANNVPALMVLAAIAQRQGATKEAEKIWQKVLSIYPLFAPAQRELAIMYSQSQSGEDQDKAYELGQKAKASLPDDEELTKTLGLLAYRHNDWKRSLLYLLEGSEKSTNDSIVQFCLGMDYDRLKKRSESTNALQNALTLGLPANLAGQARSVLAGTK